MCDAVVCKTQASKHYIVSLLSVLKDKRSGFCQSVQLPLAHVCSSEVGHLIDICKSSISIFLVLTKQANGISFMACINVHRT